MRNLKFILVVCLFLLSLKNSAQVSINVNIGSRPDWCTNYYYDNVEYVYLPEIECYYDVRSAVYVYFGGNGWIRSRYLPEYCRNYNPNPNYIVVLDYHGNAPFHYFNNHRTAYFRDCHRNYRREYYGNRYYLPNQHVVNNNYYYKNNRSGDDNRRNDDRDDRNYNNGRKEYKQENRGNDNRYVYQNNNGNRGGNKGRNFESNDNRGNGNGRGNGRR